MYKLIESRSWSYNGQISSNAALSIEVLYFKQRGTREKVLKPASLGYKSLKPASLGYVFFL